MNVLVIIVSYLIGSVPSALIIGKIFYKGKDVRKEGSGNLGTTNMLRTLGVRAALATASYDVLVKGTLTTAIAVVLYDKGIITVFPLFVGMSAVIGHVYPIFAKFKGGKSVATSFGILLALDYRIFILAGLILIINLLVNKMMALGSLMALYVGFILVGISNHFTKIEYFTVILYLIFVTYLHRNNLKRIFKGEEKKIDLIKIYKEKVGK